MTDEGGRARRDEVVRHERVTICAIAAGIVLTLPLPAAPQQTGKLVRIGCLSAASEAAAGHFFDAFCQRLRELRYVEGRDVVLEYRWANGRYERLPALAAELVREPVDLIFATSAPAATAARDATTTVPIVMRITGDPVETGLATSMARPGGNITGVADFVSPIGKHIEFLKQVAPRLKRVAVLQNPAGNQTEVQLRQSREVARALGLELYAVGARTPQELDAAFASIVADRSGALAVLADGLFTIHRARIAEFALKARLPAIYARREFAEAGGLMSYGSSLSEQYRLVANLVDKILRGAKPADLPVEQPGRFELVLNVKTPHALGLTIPPSLLLRADRVLD